MRRRPKGLGHLSRGSIAEDPRHRQRLEGSADDMRCPHTMGIVGRLGLEQFRVREDDPELIVQAVEESRKIACVLGSRAIFGHVRGVGWLRGRPSNAHQAALVGDDIRKPSG